MSAIVYNAIRGTTSGTPGTGAFTPNAAVSGYRAWSTTNVPSGWIGLVRFEDGTSWELTWSYWNGTTLSRASTQMFDSSSGSAISLTSSATAAMVLDGNAVMPNIGSVAWRGWVGGLAGGAATGIGVVAPTVTGTGSGPSPTATNALTEQPGSVSTSLTTANAQAAWSTTSPAAVVSTSAGRGGFRFSTRFGASALPTGPRMFVGMTNVTFIANTGEPSALQSASVAVFAKDSGDTNIQLLTNDGSVSNGTKIDTGIVWTATGLYEAKIWCEPGSNKVYALLIRTDTGAIWYGSTVTDVPATGALMFPQIIGSLSSTTGTAIVMKFDTMAILGGF